MNYIKIRTLSFIDASNIIYGAKYEKWKVDFSKLFKYLKERYNSENVFYFGGFDEKDKKQINFYNYLISVGCLVVTRKIKIFINNNLRKKKSNCDVDIAFYVMKNLNNFDRMIFLSGDGDFDILLKYIISLNKKVVVFANPKRTAKEIKIIKEIQFNSLSSIKEIIKK